MRVFERGVFRTPRTTRRSKQRRTVALAEKIESGHPPYVLPGLRSVEYHLKMEPQTPATRAIALANKGRDVLKTHRAPPPNSFGMPTLDSGAFSAWKTQSLAFLCSVLPPDNPYVKDFETTVKGGFRSHVESGVGILDSVAEDLSSGNIVISSITASSPRVNSAATDNLKLIAEGFHAVARQLQQRRENRPTLTVKDEYDVQDLLHALLRIYFADIRSEEWNPSYAGKSTRSDFLLKTEKIVVEVKMTRDTLSTKDVGNQIIEDIAHYKNNQDCKQLVCLIYDPQGLIRNPRGIESDLSSTSTEFPVTVFVRP